MKKSKSNDQWIRFTLHQAELGRLWRSSAARTRLYFCNAIKDIITAWSHARKFASPAPRARRN